MAPSPEDTQTPSPEDTQTPSPEDAQAASLEDADAGSLEDTTAGGTDDLLDERLYQQFCFACGRQNPLGLQMQFRRDGNDGVVCEYTPRREHQGFPGVMHGGVLVALMDEAMAWAMYAAHRALGVTAKMETRYRRSASPDAPLTIRARVGRLRGRRIEVESSIEDSDGASLVEASALFLRVPADEEATLLGALGWDLPGPHADPEATRPD